MSEEGEEPIRQMEQPVPIQKGALTKQQKKQETNCMVKIGKVLQVVACRCGTGCVNSITPLGSH